MEKLFRSRGIRLLKGSDVVLKQMKIYYESGEHYFNNQFVCKMIKNGLINYFEYSCLEDGTVDTYNFHVNLLDDYSELYQTLELYQKEIIDEIPFLFDENYRNYTVGYRMKGKEILSSSFYFYPTINREGRYRIKGITDKVVIDSEIKRFSKKVCEENNMAQEEIMRFGAILKKLKGVSVHITNANLGYKLYGRVDVETLKSFFRECLDYELDNDFSLYGEIVLVAQRIEENKIPGYNIYFLK